MLEYKWLSLRDNVNMVEELSKEEIEEYKRVFAVFDKDGDGNITIEELKAVMERMGQNGTDEELESEIKEIDLNGNGEIDLEEFLTVMPKMKFKEEIKNAFKVFDPDNNGVIKSKELKHAFLNLVKGIDEREVMEMIECADVDGDGKIQYEKLIQLIIHT